MKSTEMTILVVEDDHKWSDRIVRSIVSLLNESSFVHDKVQAESQIFRAGNVHEAREVIAGDYKLNLVTMDIDLDTETGDGLRLLELLSEKQPDAARLVISGRGRDESVYRPSFARHNVLTVLTKGEADPHKLKSTLWAALRLAHIIRLKNGDRLDTAAKEVDSALQDYVEEDYIGAFREVANEIKHLRSHQITELPNQNRAHDRIVDMLRSGQNWEFACLEIRNLGEFKRRNPGNHSLEVIKIAAMCLSNATETYHEQVNQQDDDLFAGYLGDTEFAVLSHGNHIRNVLQLAQEIFDEKIKAVYSNAAGLLSIDVKFNKYGTGTAQYGDLNEVLEPNYFNTNSTSGWN